MEQWEKDLREEIRGAFKSNPIIVPPKPNKTQIIRPVLFFAIVLLMIMNFIVIEQKHPGFFVNKVSQYIGYNESEPVQESDEGVDLVAMLQEFDSRISMLESNHTDPEEFKEWRNKIYLMAIVSDENAAISKKILSQGNHEGQDFIHIDPDWKISRMPSHIKMTPDTRNFLKGRVR